MFIKKGTLLRLKSNDELRKVATEIFNDNKFVFKRNNIYLTKDMLCIGEFAANRDFTLTERTPLKYGGWCWYPWMLDFKSRCFEVE